MARARANVTQETKVIEARKCEVVDRSVNPCVALSDAVVGPGSFSNAKGIVQWTLINARTGRLSRSFFGAKSKTVPNGICFNWCPFCGTDISAPFHSDEQETQG